MNVIETLEKEEIARLGKTIPRVRAWRHRSRQRERGRRRARTRPTRCGHRKRNRGLNSSFVVARLQGANNVPDLLAAAQHEVKPGDAACQAFTGADARQVAIREKRRQGAEER
jgi:hypothetical protein